MLETLKLLIAAVPALVRLLSELAGWLKVTFGDDPVKVIQEYTETIERLKNAKTPAEKSEAAARLSAILRRL
jgi:hypothetical protein